MADLALIEMITKMQQDMNTNFTKMQQGMNVVAQDMKDQVSALESSIGQQVSALESRIGALQGAVDGLKGDTTQIRQALLGSRVSADTGLAQHAEDMLNIGVDLQDSSTCLLAVVNALEDDQKKLALAIENGSVSTQAALIEALGVTEVNLKLALKKGQDDAIDRTCAILVPKYQVLENLIVSKRDCNCNTISTQTSSSRRLPLIHTPPHSDGEISSEASPEHPRVSSSHSGSGHTFG